MADEPTLDEIPEDLDHPLTRRDVAALRSDLARLRDSLAGFGESLASKASTKELVAVGTELRRQIAEAKEETLDHFDAAVENIRESLVGANAGDLNLLRDKTQAHDTQLIALERREGLR